MNEQEKEEQRKECLNKAIGKRDYVVGLIRQLNKEYTQACESVDIWSKKND